MTLENLKTKLINKTPKEIAGLIRIDNNPIDMRVLLKVLNITINEETQWNKLDLDGYIHLKNGYPEIWLNNGLIKERANFTLAHQLGHIIYDILPNSDSNPIEDSYDTIYRKSIRPIEVRANVFAMNLLLPKHLVVYATKNLSKEKNFEEMNLDTTIKHLAKHFIVPYEIMKTQLIYLGYISKNAG